MSTPGAGPSRSPMTRSRASQPSSPMTPIPSRVPASRAVSGEQKDSVVDEETGGAEHSGPASVDHPMSEHVAGAGLPEGGAVEQEKSARTEYLQPAEL
jgi:hypothetical protein